MRKDYRGYRFRPNRHVDEFYKKYSTLWTYLRSQQLAKQPFCQMCDNDGRVRAGQVVDHIEPFRGNFELFRDKDNLQTLCKSCHDKHKQRLEAKTRHYHKPTNIPIPIPNYDKY